MTEKDKYLSVFPASSECQSLNFLNSILQVFVESPQGLYSLPTLMKGNFVNNIMLH